MTAPDAHDGPAGLPRAGLCQWGEPAPVGPLVVTVAVLDAQGARALADLPVAAWPAIPPADLRKLARRVSLVLPHDSVVLAPRRFNSLLNKVSGRDQVLNWAYRRALRSMLERYPGCRTSAFDHHSPAFAVLDAELPGDPPPTIVYTGRGGDLAVAAAGIVARATFLTAIATLEHRLGLRPPAADEDPVPFLTKLRDEQGRAAVLATAKKDDPRVRTVLDADD